jgi:hypothetical protein
VFISKRQKANIFAWLISAKIFFDFSLLLLKQSKKKNLTKIVLYIDFFFFVYISNIYISKCFSCKYNAEKRKKFKNE